MADLSQLTDEQLQVYKEMLAQKQGTPEKTWIGTPKLPEDEGPLMNLFHMPVRGLQDIGAGVSDIATPGKRLKGAHEVISGVGRVGSLALPTAAAAAPVVTALGLAGAGLGGAAGSGIASSLGAGEDVQNLSGDVGSIVGGGIGGVAGKLPPVSAVVKGAAKGAWQEGTAPTTLFRHGLSFDLPKFVTDAVIPGYLGGRLGGEPGARIGAGLGALYPFVRGGIRGARAGLSEYRASLGEEVPPTGAAPGPVKPPGPAGFSPQPAQLPPGSQRALPPASVPKPPPPETAPPPAAFMDMESTGLGIPQEYAARGAVAAKLSRSLHANKVTVDQIEAMNPQEAEHFWKTWGRVHKEGYIPSELTREQTLRQLNMLESAAQRGRYSGLGNPASGQE